jgi:hypothetical protein
VCITLIIARKRLVFIFGLTVLTGGYVPPPPPRLGSAALYHNFGKPLEYTCLNIMTTWMQIHQLTCRVCYFFKQSNRHLFFYWTLRVYRAIAWGSDFSYANTCVFCRDKPWTWSVRLQCLFEYSELQHCKRKIVLISVVGARIKGKHSSVGIAAGWTAGVRFLAGARFFSSQCPDRLWDPPSLVSIGYRVKQPGREADYSPPSSFEVKNGGAMPPLPPYFFMV